MERITVVFVFAMVLSVGCFGQDAGQQNAGVAPATISGVVVDSSGAVIVGARISLLDSDGALRQRAATNENGEFSLTQPAPGKYVVQVEKHLFQTETRAVEVIEVYRGANALEFGASSLGGAINMVSPTGRTHRRVETRVELGSYNNVRGQLRIGYAFDNGFDYFAAVSGFHTDGFRQNSDQLSTRFYGNVGYRFSAKSEGRFFFGVDRVNAESPGAITRAQTERDPSALFATALATPLLFSAALGLALWLRVLLAAMVLAPLGVLLGMPFPLGLRIVSEEVAALVPWAWGVNGFFTVIGTVSALMIGMTFGFKIALLAGAACYLIALVAIAKGGQMRKVDGFK